MELFFEEPTKNFQIRQISRATKIAVTSVKNYLGELVREKLIKKDRKTLYPSYIANSQNRLFKVHKQQFILFRLYATGLIDYLEDRLHPSCIVLFGSMRKGEYNKKSDIDLFVQSCERELELGRFERKLKHAINLFFEEDINKLRRELFGNIVNGRILSGYLKIK